MPELDFSPSTASKLVVMLLDNTFTADARVEKEAIALIHAGYQVKVLCLEGAQLPKQEVRNEIQILRCLEEGYNAPLKSGYKSYIEHAASLVIQHSPDILHCHDFYMLSIGSYVKKKKPSIHLIYDAHEFLKGWPFYKTSKGLNRWKGRIVYEVLVKKERREMKEADQVITITEGIATRIARWANLTRKPIVLGNYPEMVEIEKDPSYFRSLFPITTKQKIIVHSGTVYHTNEELKTLFNTVVSCSEFALIFIGNRPRFEEVRKMVQENSEWSNNIFFHDYPNSQSATIKLLAHADLGLLFINDQWIAHQIGFSNRFVEYIMAGIPVVGIAQEYSMTMNDTYHCSIFFSNSDKLGLSNALHQMSEHYLNFKQHAQNARKDLSWNKEVQKLINHYNSI